MTDLFSETPASILSHHADKDAVDSFILWRKKIRKPLTDRAAKMIAKTLLAINRGGGDATEALDLAQEHGWQTIKPDWYWRHANVKGTNSANASNKAGMGVSKTAASCADFGARWAATR